MLPVPPTALAIALLVTLIAALVQGSIGLGFAVLSVPVLSLVDARLAPVPQLLVALPLTVSMAIREHRAVELRGVGWVLVGRVPGIGIGIILLSLASPRLLDGIIGASVLLATAVLSSNIKITRNWRTEIVAGIASGISGAISSIGGPPLALLYRDDQGETIRANLAALFATGVVITIAARLAAGLITATDAWVSLCLLPALLVGLIISRYTRRFARGRLLRWSVLALSAAAALGLLVRALST